ncbi:MAG: chorismate-binding protein, partial [Muribaculaceae bacterium]|nr:chorismate-binding protein [Muribaculaceae bacterium]
AQERNARGCYGGFCGPYRSAEDFTFYVNLRCAQIERERYCIYSGGGITLKSDTEKEWEETELKATTINDSLCKY